MKTVRRDAFSSARPYDREFTGIQSLEPISRGHESLVDILQVGRNEVEGFFYYVMELADGGGTDGPLDPESYVPLTLGEDLKRRGRIPVVECLLLFRSLAFGLSYLHRAGLVHRDIKSSNIIFVRGIAKFADIGLVAAADESLSYVGTEGFIPPEGAGTVSADLFSLGKVLYEAATGKDRTEFPSLPVEVLEFNNYPALLELNAIWLKACAHSAEDRYTSADEMASDLALLQAGRSVKRLRVFERRIRRARQLAGIIAMVALAAGLVGFLERRRASAEHDIRVESDRLRDRAELAEREVRRQLEEARVAQARALIRGHQIGRRQIALNLLTNIQSPTLRVEARGYAATALVLPDLVRESALTNTASPNSSSGPFARPASDGSIQIRGSSEASSPVVLPPQGEPVRNPLQFHLDGRFLYAGYGRVVERIWDVPSRRIVATLDTNYYELAFRPNRPEVAVGYVDGHVRLHGLPSWEVLQEWSVTNSEIRLHWNPDGSRLVLLIPGGRSAYATVGKPELEPIDLPAGASVQIAVWDPSGLHFALGCGDGYVRVRGVDQWSDFTVLSRHEAQLVDMLFLPPFPWILTSSWDGTSRLWDWHSASELGRIEATSYGLHYEPATRRLNWRVGSEDPMRPWKLVGDEMHKELAYGDPRTLGGPFMAAWSRDSRYLVTGDSENIRVWRVEDGVESLRIPGAAEALCTTAQPPGLLANSLGAIRRWSFEETGDGHLRAQPSDPLGHAEILGKLAADRDGSTVAWIDGGSLHCRRGEVTRTFRHGQEQAEKICLSPDGRWVAVGTRNHIGVRVLDAIQGTPLWNADIRYGSHPVFSHDSQWLAVGTESGCYVYASATGQRRWHRAPNPGEDPSFWEVAFSPDDSMVAWTPKSSLVQLLDASTGNEILTLDYPSRRYITHLVFSPDGEWLAESSNKHTVHLWKIQALKRELALMGLGW